MSAILSDMVGQSITSPTRASPSDRAKSGNGATAHESMAEPELLALIIEMRLSDGRTLAGREKPETSNSTSSPTAGKENSAVDTMDLCHRKIHKLPEEMVDIIKDDVVRLALGYNFITTLPSSFVDLSKLRYLNVRANLMGAFPEVLCSLPSLEILDMSRNKVRKLPERPGRLAELRVLSIANNRVRRLPAWLMNAKHMRILKIEGNPINWPPPHISVMPAFEKASVVDGSAVATASGEERSKEKSQLARKKAEDKHMLLWLIQLKSWIAENAGKEVENVDKAETPLRRQEGTRRLDVGAILDSDQRARKMLVNSGEAAAAPPTSEAEATEQLPSTAEQESTSDEEREQEKENVIALAVTNPRAEGGERGINIPRDAMIAELRNQKVLDAPLSSSPEAVVSAPEGERSVAIVSRSIASGEEEDAAKQNLGGGGFSAVSSVGTGNKIERPFIAHQRNDSLDHATTRGRPRPIEPAVLLSKNSLPDMRPAHTAKEPNEEDNEMGGTHTATASAGEASGTDTALSTSQRRTPELAVRRKPAPIITGAEDPNFKPSNIELDIDATTPAGAVETERNSYFKRLSTLPASSISTHVSISVLLCIDATRGILYALSQMHTAFRQYVAFATDERLTSQLSRVLGIAGNSMAVLINALDRFDSQSRTKNDTMDPRTIRGVIVATVDSIQTFGKLVHVVRVQLKSLQTGADIRYTRTLLLLLYGSLAEIVNSWSTVEPLLADVAPFMLGVDASKGTPDHGFSTTSNSFGHSALPSIAEANSPVTPSSRTRVAIPPIRPQRRRHAGSFSAHDLVQGASMASTTGVVANAIDDAGGLEEVDGRDAAIQRSTASGQIGNGEGQNDGASTTAKVSERTRKMAGSEADGRRTLSSSSNTGLHSQRQAKRGETLVDDHLIQLVVRITSVAFSVWVGIENHLGALGLPVASSSGHSMKASNASTTFSAHEEDANGSDTGVPPLPKTPLRFGRAMRQQASEPSMGGQIASPETPAQGVNTSRSTAELLQSSTPQSVVSAGGRAAHTSSSTPSPAFQRRLRQLYDLTRGVDEHTHRLYACLERAQEAVGQTPTPVSPPSGSNTDATGRHLRSVSTVSSNANSNSNSAPSDSVKAERNGQGAKDAAAIDRSATLHDQAVGGRDLFSESGHFIKSVLQISHFVKGLAAEGFALPKYVKASLAELTTCARDLTLHLHFLSGPTPTSIQQPQPAHAPNVPVTANPMQSSTGSRIANNPDSTAPASAPAHPGHVPS